MKQQKKNNTKQSVTWPTTTYFTLKELHALNSAFVEITLRVRLSNSIKDGKVAEIGSIPGNMGRPEKIFALTPISQLVIDKAVSNKINLVDNWQRLVNVVSVKSPPSQQSVLPSLKKTTVSH
jgi:hypothetical protein